MYFHRIGIAGAAGLVAGVLLVTSAQAAANASICARAGTSLSSLASSAFCWQHNM